MILFRDQGEDRSQTQSRPFHEEIRPHTVAHALEVTESRGRFNLTVGVPTENVIAAD